MSIARKLDRPLLADLIPFSVYPLFIVLFFVIQPSFEKQLASALLAISGICVTACLSRHYKEPPSPPEKRKKSQSIVTSFFGILFSIIVALAITEALISFNLITLQQFLVSRTITDPIIEGVLLLVSFLSMAILFFQCGATFLSTDAANYITERGMFFVFINFLFLFLEALIIFFMATNLHDPNAFVFLLLILTGIDIAWVLAFLRIKTVVFSEWLHYDLFVAFFSLTILVTSIQFQTYFLMVAVLVARSIADYASLWKRFWVKFPVPG